MRLCLSCYSIYFLCISSRILEIVVTAVFQVTRAGHNEHFNVLEWVLMIAHVVLVSLRAVEFLVKPVVLTVFLKQVSESALLVRNELISLISSRTLHKNNHVITCSALEVMTLRL